jgi:hypothetical protein
MRYAFMGRRVGQPLAEYSGIGYGNLPHSRQQPNVQRRVAAVARGTNFNVFDPEDD